MVACHQVTAPKYYSWVDTDPYLNSFGHEYTHWTPIHHILGVGMFTMYSLFTHRSLFVKWEHTSHHPSCLLSVWPPQSIERPSIKIFHLHKPLTKRSRPVRHIWPCRARTINSNKYEHQRVINTKVITTSYCLFKLTDLLYRLIICLVKRVLASKV